MTVWTFPHDFDRCRSCQANGYHKHGTVTRVAARPIYGVGTTLAGTPCKCGRYRRFVWEAGRELCDGCEVDTRRCKCVPIWALQAGIVT